MVTKARSKKAPATKRKSVTKAKSVTPHAVVLQASDVPAIGQPWPGQGGIRIAECLGVDGKPNYHLLLIADSAGKPVILEDRQWGEYGKEIKGANSHRDGLANTEAMLAAGNSLAKEARKHGPDAYVPSLCELGQIRANFPAAPKTWFWSSTQDGANDARYQSFE